MTDEQLLENAAAGDETAFALLYQRHRDLVFRFTYRLLQSPEAALIWWKLTNCSVRGIAARFQLQIRITTKNLLRLRSEGHVQ
jgi:hypothetical protein